MKKIYALLIAVAFCSTVLAQTTKKSETQNQQQTGQSKQEADMMQKWTAYMTPGPMHQMMAKWNGDWNEEVTFWMTPGAPPTKNTSTCTNTMIMGNRYQETRHTSVMNGMQFEGRGILGYDNAKKVFTSTWIDNMGTGIMTLEGKWDDKNKTIHFTGTSIDPMTGKNENIREEFKLVDDNNQIMEMYMSQDGKEYKSMEIRFTRKM